MQIWQWHNWNSNAFDMLMMISWEQFRIWSDHSFDRSLTGIWWGFVGLIRGWAQWLAPLGVWIPTDSIAGLLSTGQQPRTPATVYNGAYSLPVLGFIDGDWCWFGGRDLFLMNTLRLHFIQQRECTLRDFRQVHQNRNDEKAAVRKNGRIVGLHVGGGGAPGCGGSWTGGSSLWPPGCLLSGAHLSMLGQPGTEVHLLSCWYTFWADICAQRSQQSLMRRIKDILERICLNNNNSISVTIWRVFLILSCWHLQCIGR